MNKFFNKQKGFLIVAIIVGFLLNRTNCTSDPDCDPDPIYGGCSTSCDYGTSYQWFTKSFGIWILLNFGSFLERENLKHREYLREFIVSQNLKYDINELNDEWKEEEDKRKKELNNLLATLEKNKNDK